MTIELEHTTAVPSPADAEFAADIEYLYVTVVDGHVEGGWGSFDPETRVVTLLPNLGVVQRRSVLAKMLGHAALGHEEWSEENEKAAAAWGARRMIVGARAAATLKAVNWLGIVAREFEVMPSDVAAYLASLSEVELLAARDAIAMEPRGFGGAR